MPLSNPWHLPVVLHYLSAIRPIRILDVGVGMGTYGFMLRQHLDIAREGIDRKAWKLTIDGIEIFEPYRNPVWNFAYDSVIVGDARKLLPGLGAYDAVICNDVLEHFEKPAAVLLAEQMLARAPVVVVTTPNCDLPQGAWGGNEAETHRCLLAASDLPSVVVHRQTTVTACFVLSRTAAAIEQLRAADRSCPTVSSATSGGWFQRATSRIKRAW